MAGVTVDLSSVLKLLEGFFKAAWAWVIATNAANTKAEAVQAKAELEAEVKHENHAQANAGLTDSDALSKLRNAKKRRNPNADPKA